MSINNFLDAMTAAGCVPASAADVKDTGGADTYIRLEGDKSKGRLVYAYKQEPDGFCWGNARNFKTSEHMSWHSKSGQKISQIERNQIKARMAAAEAAQQAAREIEQAESAARCKARWTAAKPAKAGHEYLKRKGIKPHGIRQEEGLLLIPAYSNNILCSMQTIDEAGDKMYAAGARMSGAFYPLADKGQDMGVILLVEGFATGATVREATDLPVVVCFDAGNLKPVARAMRDKYPDARLIVAGDNDRGKVNAKGLPYNTGLDKAQQAAVSVDGHFLVPPFTDDDEGSDWNDYAALYGNDRVRDLLMDVVNAKAIVQEVRKAPALADWMDQAMWKDSSALIYDNAYSQHNSILHLTYAPQFAKRLAHDTFADKVVIVGALPWDDDANFEHRYYTDGDIVRIKAALETQGLQMQKNAVKDSIEVAARNNPVNPVREYMDTLAWDGDARLDTWLTDYLGATEQPPELLARFGACWLMAGAKRIYEPGAPFHHMLVLEGGQAAGKSSALKTLATFGRDKKIEYFTDRISFDQIDKAEFSAFAAGHLIIEFQEMSGLGKKDRNRVKMWLTQSSDEVQKKFENASTTYKRQFIAAGTTNDSNYLTDPTGNRRFWPVKVGEHIDLIGLAAVKDQLWAEAIHRYKLGEIYYIPPEDPIYLLMEREQSMRYEGDPWDDIISDYLSSRPVVKIDDIMRDALTIPKERWDRAGRFRVASVLKNLGYVDKTAWCKIEGKNKRSWVRK